MTGKPARVEKSPVAVVTEFEIVVWESEGIPTVVVCVLLLFSMLKEN